jgi:hypothetical protein
VTQTRKYEENYEVSKLERSVCYRHLKTTFSDQGEINQGFVTTINTFSILRHERVKLKLHELIKCVCTKLSIHRYISVLESLYPKGICTLAETKIGRLVYSNGRQGGTVVTITLLFTFIIILLTVRLPTHLEQNKSVCPIIYLYIKKTVLCLKR